MLKRLFTDHPATVGESYGEHFGVASWYGIRMLGGGMACMVHAIFPFLFLHTGSATINRLQKHMTDRMGPADAAPAAAKANTAATPIADPGTPRG